MKTGSVVFLSRANLITLGATDMNIILPSVSEAFQAISRGDVIQPAKTTLKFLDNNEAESGLVNVLPAAIKSGADASFGLKVLGAMPSNVMHGIPRATGVIVLFDGHTKTPRAIMDAQIISAMRTGAVSALAAQKLCRLDSQKLGLVGAGVNMRTQLLGIMSVMPDIKKVSVYSMHQSKNDFVADMQKRFPNIVFNVAYSADEAVQDADIVITCIANSSAPVVSAEAVNRPGITILNIGCLENEPSLLKDMNLIVSDRWEHSKHRGVQTHAVAYEQGIINDSDVVDLDQILSGKIQGRTTPDQKIFFCPTGLGVEDVIVATDLLRRAHKEGIGTPLILWDEAPWI